MAVDFTVLCIFPDRTRRTLVLDAEPARYDVIPIDGALYEVADRAHVPRDPRMMPVELSPAEAACYRQLQILLNRIETPQDWAGVLGL